MTVLVEGNGDSVPVDATKAYRGSRGIASVILNPSTWCRLEVNFTHWLLYPQGKNPWLSIEQEAGVGPKASLDTVE